MGSGVIVSILEQLLDWQPKCYTKCFWLLHELSSLGSPKIRFEVAGFLRLPHSLKEPRSVKAALTGQPPNYVCLDPQGLQRRFRTLV